MMSRMKIVVLILALLCLLPASDAAGRKVGYKVNVKKGSAVTGSVSGTEVDPSEAEPDGDMVRGSFMVASQCPDCNNGYRISQISFSGYDKPTSSRVESFFITNHTDRTMTALTLYIDYRTPDGRQLHKQFVKLSCMIPPGETRRAELKSWDSQRAFHYIKSPAGKKGSAPFAVTFDPVAFYLRY